MTDRVRQLVVTLDRDMRDDDVEYLVGAIKLLRNVAHVDTKIVKGEDHIARMVVRSELERNVYAAIGEVFNPSPKCNVPMCGESGVCAACRKAGAR